MREKALCSVFDFFAGILAEGSEKLTNFLCAPAIKSIKGNEDHKAWEAMLADFEHLANGSIDVIDAEGTSWDFVLVFSNADAECRCNDWGLTHYSAADEVCPECLAILSNRPYTDLSRNATWRPTADMPFES